MQLDHHLGAVHDQLLAAAALGDERTREIAGTLAGTATSAVRLALIGAVSQAADETTAALLDYPGAPAVAARLDGDEITLEVRATAAVDADGTEPRRDDGEPNARISLRLAETLKADIDAAAERDGVSVNTWLVRAATAALEPKPFGPQFLGGMGAGNWRFDPFSAGADSGGKRRNSHHITGWIDG